VSGLYAVVPIDGLQVREAANGQPLFVPLAAVHHTVNMLRQDFSGLNYHRLIAGLQLTFTLLEETAGGRSPAQGLESICAFR
jgi:hypothetical protein